MSAEIIMAGCSLVGVAMVAWTQVRVIRKNGGDKVRTDQKLLSKVDTVIEKIDDPRNGLGAIHKAQTDMQAHCEGMTSGFNERIKNIEKRK